jgi:hypothetical protein
MSIFPSPVVSDPALATLLRRLRDLQSENDRLERLLESRPIADESMPTAYRAWSFSVDAIKTLVVASD